MNFPINPLHTEESVINSKDFTNVITIENKYIKQHNFSLKNIKKGKLYKGSNHNAYKRENLGSIPSKIENILFKDNLTQMSLGFNSQTVRFTNTQTITSELTSSSYQNNDNKNLIDNSSNSKNKKNLNNSLNLAQSLIFSSPSIGSKGYGGFASKEKRFAESLKTYEEKYLPSAADYNLKSFVDNKYRFKYQSLFKNQFFKNDSLNSNPGPGKYNIHNTYSNIMEKNSNNFLKPLKNEIKLDLIEKELSKERNYFNNTEQFMKNYNSIKKKICSSLYITQSKLKDLKKKNDLNNSNEKLIKQNIPNITKERKINKSSKENIEIEDKDEVSNNKVNISYEKSENVEILNKKKANFRGKNLILDLDSKEILIKAFRKGKFGKYRINESEYKNNYDKQAQSEQKQKIINVIESANKKKRMAKKVVKKVAYVVFNKRKLRLKKIKNKSSSIIYSDKNVLKTFTKKNSSNLLSENITKDSIFFSNIDLKQESLEDKEKKQIEKIRQNDELMKKFKKIKERSSHFFISNTKKSELKSCNSKFPGPSFYNPSYIPSMLSFNVNNTMFKGNLSYLNSNKDKKIWI